MLDVKFFSLILWFSCHKVSLLTFFLSTWFSKLKDRILIALPILLFPQLSFSFHLPLFVTKRSFINTPHELLQCLEQDLEVQVHAGLFTLLLKWLHPPSFKVSCCKWWQNYVDQVDLASWFSTSLKLSSILISF